MLSSETEVGPPATTSSLLEAALSRLVARAGASDAGDPVVREDIGAKLTAIAVRVREILGETPSDEDPAPVPLERRDARLIRALGAEVLGARTPPAAESATLTLLRAIESLLAEVDGDDPEDLEALMARPDGFELLVEVAHDLRSPLTSILFLAEALRSGHSGELNELQHSQLGLIYSAAMGLVSITSDVLDLVRNEAWWVDQGAEPYSVQDVFQRVAEMVRPMAEEKHIDLIITPPHHDRAFGHPFALSRVLLNLTTNAIKFTDKGFVEVGATRRDQRRMEYYVRDTGRGMPPEMQAELFQPIKKRPRRQGVFFSGSGLGLSIVRRILRTMGSDLQVESAPDWGTRFFFLVDVPPLP